MSTASYHLFIYYRRNVSAVAMVKRFEELNGLKAIVEWRGPKIYYKSSSHRYSGKPGRAVAVLTQS
jgi:hypothetical protein